MRTGDRSGLAAGTPGRPGIDRSDAPAGELAVRAEGLAKLYRHPWTLKVTAALTAATFEVRTGEVFGYLGPNGAGKTTTLKLLTGLLKPTHGRAWLLGEPIENVSSRVRLGFLPEQPYFYDYLNGIEYLEFVARLSGLGAHEANRAARHWLGRVGLGERARLRLRKYSKGMLQRLGLAAAMVHEPRLLILDEPMSGLDPFGRRDVRDLILEQRDRGTTVMLSSHILPDVEALCDRVAIVLAGRVERVAAVRELMDGASPRVEMRVAGTPLLELPAELASVTDRRTSGGDTVLTLRESARQQALLECLVHQHAQVRAVTPLRGSLEELFMAAAADAAFQAPAAQGVA